MVIKDVIVASVMSTPINFTKEIALDAPSHPTWILSKADPINITSSLVIKRTEPKLTKED
jgi:hypothetical protein